MEWIHQEKKDKVHLETLAGWGGGQWRTVLEMSPIFQSTVHIYWTWTDWDGFQLCFCFNSKWKGYIFVFFLNCFQQNITRINILDYIYLAIYPGDLSFNTASVFQCIHRPSFSDGLTERESDPMVSSYLRHPAINVLEGSVRNCLIFM